MQKIFLDFIKYINKESKKEIKDVKEFMDIFSRPSSNTKNLSELGWFFREMLGDNCHLLDFVMWIAFYFQHPGSKAINEEFFRNRSWIPIKSNKIKTVDKIYTDLYYKYTTNYIQKEFHLPSILQRNITYNGHSHITDTMWVMVNPLYGGNKIRDNYYDKEMLEYIKQDTLGRGISSFFVKDKEIIINYYNKNISMCPKKYKLNKILKEPLEETYRKYMRACYTLFNSKDAICEYHVRIPLFWDPKKQYSTETYLAVSEHNPNLIIKLNYFFVVLYNIIGLINNKHSYYIGKTLGEQNKKLKMLKNEFLGGIKLIGSSSENMAFETMVDAASKLNVNISISGEYGTGKSFIARKIHRQSDRNNRTLVVLNNKNFEPSKLRIKRGTIILEKLYKFDDSAILGILNFINSTIFIRNKNLVIILITDETLLLEVEKRPILSKIFAKLSEFKIHCPALRDKKEDLDDFFTFYAKYYSLIYDKQVSISYNAKKKLESYAWPGNIRELRSVFSSIIASCRNNKISSENIPKGMLESKLEEDDFIKEVCLGIEGG